jgi:hypothetical protein
MTRPVELPERRLFWSWVWTSVRPYVGWALAAAGGIALFVGWFGVSGESLTAKQLPYLVSAGLTGIALFILAGVFLATDDVRRQFARIAELERKVDDLYSLFIAEVGTESMTDPTTDSTTDSTTRPAAARGALLALPSGSSYHSPDCALVAGKAEAAPVTPDVVSVRGLRPCRVCEPDAGRTAAAAR